MNDSDLFICGKCKKQVNSSYLKSYGVCKECYAKAFDEGFSSQADYSDKMFELQQKEKEERNELINKEIIDDKDILYFIEGNLSGVFYCRKCDKQRVSRVKFEKMRRTGKLLELLKQECPKCHVTGYLYFH